MYLFASSTAVFRHSFEYFILWCSSKYCLRPFNILILSSVDGSTTSIDKKFTFTVLAKDRLGYSAIARTFTLTVQETGLNEYSNLYMQPFINTDVKNKFLNFMNEDATFTPDSIYRPSDKNFGIQKNLRA